MTGSLADAPPPATALPLATGPAPAYTPARAVSALPPAPSAPLGRIPPTDQYAYLNQAYAFSQSLADAPPDYTYDYQGERPWVWQSPDGYYRVAERLPIGVRYFYYAPGASEPYLVQDPRYSYGYSGGLLTVVYGPDGQVLPYDVEARQARDAGLYLAWAAGLYAAARHQAHVAVSQDRWDADRQAIYADQARWSAAQQRNAAWATYHQAHQNDEAHWADQRYVRAAEAARFAQTAHDETAFAHAQRAAVDARRLSQSRPEQSPGPAPDGGGERRRPGPAEGGASGLTAGGLAGGQRQQPRAPFQDQDQAPPHPHTNVEVQRQTERPAGAQGLADARAQQAAQAVAGRQAAAHGHEAQAREAAAQQAQVHEQQAAARQIQTAPDAQRAVTGRADADARLQAAEQAAASRQAQAQAQAVQAAQRAASDRAQADARRQVTEQAAAQAQRGAQATAPGRPAQVQLQAPPPPQTPHAAPNPPKPPADPKHKPDEPHP